MIDHSSCDHPRTSKDRAACRKAMAKGSTHDAPIYDAAGIAGPRPPATPSPYNSLADANAQGAIHHDTLDDRIRDSRRRPKASPVTTKKVDPASLTR